MKILLLSDNHGEDIKKIIETHKEVKYILHCGDSLMTDSELESLNVIAVKGNNDKNEQPDMQILDLDGTRVLLTHGHLENVNDSMITLQYLAQENDIDIVCFGHTHFVFIDNANGVTFVNPGALYNPFSKYGKTYAVVTVTDTTRVELFSVNNERLEMYEYCKRGSVKGV